jgi:hypothetical protein
MLVVFTFMIGCLPQPLRQMHLAIHVPIAIIVLMASLRSFCSLSDQIIATYLELFSMVNTSL